MNSASLYTILCPYMGTLSGSLTGFPVHFLLLFQNKQRIVENEWSIPTQFIYEINLLACTQFLATKILIWNVVKME